jgi:hypothetical protein
MDRSTDRHNEASSRFSQFANEPINAYEIALTRNWLSYSHVKLKEKYTRPANVCSFCTKTAPVYIQTKILPSVFNRIYSAATVC